MPTESAARIAVVRPDLLGTYGDGGNATILQRRLELRGIQSVVLPVGEGTPLPAHVDLILLGGSEDAAQAAFLDDARIGAAINRAVTAGAVILGVCGGLQSLGHSLCAADGIVRGGLGILDCVTDARLRSRACGEIIVDPADSLGIPAMTGFENHGGRTRIGPSARAIGRVRIGVGNGHARREGAFCGRVFGTYLHGPVLARNPAFADLLLTLVVGPLEPLDLPDVETLRKERLRAATRTARFSPTTLRRAVTTGL